MDDVSSQGQAFHPSNRQGASPELDSRGQTDAVAASSHDQHPPYVPSNGSSVDLRLLEYVSGFDRNLMCPICHCPFIQAVRLGCDHTFCKQCLRQAWQNQSRGTKTCPSCRSSTASSDMLPVPRFLTHMIDELVVKCPTAHLGCSAQLKRGDVPDHVDFYCDFAEVDCPSQDCTLKISRNAVSRGCLHGIVQCEYCQTGLMERDLKSHLQKYCTMKQASCDHCKENMAQSELEGHSKNCSELILSCPASSIGCSFKTRRIEMEFHASNCSLAALLPTIQSMGQKINAQNALILDLQRKNDILEGSLAQMQSLPSRITNLGQNEPADFPTAAALPSVVENVAHSPLAQPRDPPFESAAHHLLSLHESIREEVDRVSSAVSELDARSNLAIMNESLRIREEMAHTNGAIRSMRMQLDWLMSSRLQLQPRGLASLAKTDAGGTMSAAGSASAPAQPTRRLSDSSRQDTKL